MKLPADWDQPSPDNKEICDKFTYGVFDYSGELPYRLFTPATDERVPMVVYLHGADALGKDNELQLTMHDIGTTFACDEWQHSHPCYVLAPQCNRGRHWSGPLDAARLCALVKELMAQHINIDPGRLYIYGYSAGGVGTMELIKYHPEIFAAAISICGATGNRDLDHLTKTPLWLLHAADDMVVKATYKTDEFGSVHLGSKDIYEELESIHPDIHYTEYEAGSMQNLYNINPHCSWVPAGQDLEVKEWLFSHARVDYAEYWEKCWNAEDPDELAGYLEGWKGSFAPEIDIFKKNNVKKVCDAACGFGAHTLALASNGFEVSAFDISKRAVELTTSGLQKYGYKADSVRCASITDTGYSSGTFDAVTAYAVIDHLTEADAKAALNELMRILKPGGLLLISFDSPDEEDYNEATSEGLLFIPYTADKISFFLASHNVLHQWATSRGSQIVILQKGQ